MGVIGTPLNSKNLKPSWELQADEDIVRVGKYGKVYEDDALRSYGASIANEGWAPASFKSQRSNRAEVVMKEATSLMDDRDIAEASKASILSILSAYDQSLLEIGEKIVNRLMGKQMRANEQTQVSFLRVPVKSVELGSSVKSFERLKDVFRSAGIVRSDDIVAPVPDLPVNYKPAGIPSQRVQSLSTADSRGNKTSICRSNDIEGGIDTKLTEQQALQALSGFMPFKNIPVKHDAYISYLKYYAGQISERPDTDESWEEEFYKAASFFKPLISELSVRFMRPSETRPDSRPTNDLPKLKQVENKLSGKRESYWRPATLLCKRFMVDPPPSDVSATEKYEIAINSPVAEVLQVVDRQKCKSVFASSSVVHDTSEDEPTIGTKRLIRPRASDFILGGKSPAGMLSQLRRFPGLVARRLLSDIRYTKNHEWAEKTEIPNQVRVGITDYAQKALGDLVYLELPKPGSKVLRNDVLGVAESVKGASDIYSPIGGTVVDVNSSVLTKPSLINKSPESDGWLCTIQVDNASEIQELLEHDAYRNFCEGDSS